jgi:hypothetical protein
MKPALILIGNIRTFELCIDSFENICNNMDVDIFICMSNYLNELHPYIQSKTTNNNNILNISEINKRFSISPIFSSKIKKIIVLDKNEEDNIIMSEYLHKFDTKKQWIGLDIFKQYYKLKLCVDFIKEYESMNNIRYDYIIKTRFDINININTLPDYPLNNNNMYIGKNENDHIFVTNSINNFEIIANDIISHFLNNTQEEYIYESIHTIVEYIFKHNNFNIIKCIDTELNRDYNSIFNTNITLVTCFYNINRENWSSHGRPLEKYFINCEDVLNKLNPIVIFTTEEFYEKCMNIRKKTDKYLIYTEIIIIPFENLHYYDKIDQIRQIQNNNLSNIYDIDLNHVPPEFGIPEYIVVINNKLKFMKHVANKNSFNSNIFQWIDFGLHPNVYNTNRNMFDQNYFNKIFYKPNKIRLTGFKNHSVINDRNNFYNSHTETVSCGLFSGDYNSITKLEELFEYEFNNILNEGLINQEQYILYYILCKNKELFDYSITDNWDNLCSTYLKNTVKVGICMSGHLRSYDSCKENIQANIISPLKNNGFIVDMFLSTWDDYGYRSDDFNTNKVDINKYKADFTSSEFESYNKDFFMTNYYTEKWKEYSHLSCNTTCPNSVSMLYKINKSYILLHNYEIENNFKYDVIIRLRPDLKFNQQIDISNIKESLFNNYLYMPTSHGKYIIVTKYIMDQLFFGNSVVMEKILNTYRDINSLIISDCPHTGEGFLWKQIMNNNITIQRFMCSYGIINKDNNCTKLFN